MNAKEPKFIACGMLKPQPTHCLHKLLTSFWLNYCSTLTVGTLDIVSGP